MESFVRLIVIAISTILILLSITSVDALPVETRVVILNTGDQPITIHCWSSEDDLGEHALPVQQFFSWHFKPNIWGSTKFVCDIHTAYGSGNYNVYDDDKDLVCSPNCEWDVSDDGLCLLSTPRGKTWCEIWQQKPNGTPIRKLLA